MAAGLILVILAAAVAGDRTHHPIPTGNIFAYLDQNCAPTVVGPPKTLILLTHRIHPGQSIFYPHLFPSGCRIQMIPLDCDRCLVEDITLTYKISHKLFLIDYPNFKMDQLNHLTDRIELIHSLCTPQCYVVVLLGGENAERAQQRVVQALFENENSLNDIVVGSYLTDNPATPSDFIYIRPVIQGCIRYEGILIPNNHKDFASLTTKPSQCNLNGTTLRVAMTDVRRNTSESCLEIGFPPQKKSHITQVSWNQIQKLFLCCFN